MNYIDILNSNYFKETYSKIEEMKKDYPVNHGFIHVFNVIENAKRLADTFKLTKKQKELLLIACTLHDIGYLEGRDDHALNGSVIAEKYLNKLGFKEEDIFIICNAIKNHGGKKTEDFTETVSMCLAIADKLDFIGKRYDKTRLKEEYLEIFPNILDTNLEYKNNELTLKIIVNNKFNLSAFQESNYFNKLTIFFNLLSEVLNSKYNVKYEILK